jgi:6-phosphogluconate dehydrogenase
MKLGFIGLGRMGYSMVERMLLHKIEVVAYNRSKEKTDEIAKKGAIPAYSVKEVVDKQKGRKIVWLMLPAGKVTDEMINEILPILNKGDILIDGANSFYGNAERHSKECAEKEVVFFDVGVSGGVWGLKNGYTLMIGGPEKEYAELEPIFQALAPALGYARFGDAGAGHFVKSTHNIVEYVYLQGIAEGMEILSKFKQPIDIKKAAHIWRPASVVRSWLMDLTDSALSKEGFAKIEPNIESVTLEELRDTAKSVEAYAPAFDVAAKIREDKTDNFTLGKRVIAAVRNEFGGHKVEKKK